MKKMKFTGYIPDIEDPRDYIYTDFFKALRKKPNEVDQRPFMSPIKDQKTLGSCVLHGFIGVGEYLWFKHGLVDLDGSELAMYYMVREKQGTINSDSGTSVRMAVKIGATLGVPPEKLWPYKVENWKIKPPPSVYEAAKKFKISKYYKLPDLNAGEDALARGFPWLFGISLHDAFWRPNKGFVADRKPGDEIRGGHAMVCVGYFVHNRKKYYIVRQSWGPRHGVNGYIYLSEGLMQYARDMWCFEIIDDGK